MEVRPLGEDGVVLFGLDEPWRWTVDHPDTIEVVPADGSLAVFWRAPFDVAAHLRPQPPEAEPPDVEVPVLYDGEDLSLFGPGAAKRHAEATYRCAFLGFLPGFPYLDGLPETLRRPRRTSPRVRVPAGSVAVAEDRCGIYPVESPGGWHLLGRTPLRMADFPIRPGAKITFRAITPEEFAAWA